MSANEATCLTYVHIYVTVYKRERARERQRKGTDLERLDVLRRGFGVAVEVLDLGADVSSDRRYQLLYRLHGHLCEWGSA